MLRRFRGIEARAARGRPARRQYDPAIDTRRITTEELHPAGERSGARRARDARRVRGARVEASGAALEPRDAGGILDLAIEGLLARLGPALLVALCFFLPYGQLVQLAGVPDVPGGYEDVFLAVWIAAAANVLPLGPTLAVVSSLVGDVLEGRRATVASAIRRGLARAPAAIAILFVTRVATFPLALACGLPYFLVNWLTYAAVPLYVLEGERLLSPAERARARRNPLAFLASFPLRGARAIARSSALARGARSLGRWVLLAVVGHLVLASLLQSAAAGLAVPEARDFVATELGFGAGAAGVALATVGALFTALAECLSSALMVAFYLDLRVRREGWDLELALSRAEAGSRTEAA